MEKIAREGFGIAPGPLDPWRGTGRVAKAMGLPVFPSKPVEPLARQVAVTSEPDPATATITKLLAEGPCPCKSKECAEEYERLTKAIASLKVQ